MGSRGTSSRRRDTNSGRPGHVSRYGNQIVAAGLSCLLATACVEVERFDNGLRALAEALAAADEHENRLFEAEAHRLKGELLLKQGEMELNEAGHTSEAIRSELRNLRGADKESRSRNGLGIGASNAAEALICFELAIEIARHQNAKSWELRSTTSLARLLVKQNRHGEARAMLTEIYNWFTEGFDTADLKDAKALIEELN